MIVADALDRTEVDASSAYRRPVSRCPFRGVWAIMVTEVRDD